MTKSRAVRQQRHLASKARHEAKRRAARKRRQACRRTLPVSARQTMIYTAPSIVEFISINEWLYRRFHRRQSA